MSWIFEKPIFIVVIGGIVEIVPLLYLQNTIEKVQGLRPYSPLELAGRNIYVREGCYVCHSQMVRPFRDAVERSKAGEAMNYLSAVRASQERYHAREATYADDLTNLDVQIPAPK